MLRTLIVLHALMVALLLAVQPGISASPLVGQVVDSRTGQALAGASIQLSGTNTGCSTGEQGQFLLEITNTSGRLFVSHLGYTSRNITLFKDQTDILIELDPSPLQLETVLVFGRTGPKEEGVEDQRQWASSTEDALDAVNNISMIRRGGYAEDPAIRGLSADRIQLRVDGMCVHGACTDRMDPVTTYVDLESLDHAVIRSGASDGRNGSAPGGSIELHHKRQNLSLKPQREIAVTLRHSSALRESASSASFAQSNKKWASRIRVAFEEAGDYQSPLGREANSGHRKANFYGNLRWQGKKTGQWDLLLQSDDAWDIGYAALPMDVSYARFRAVSLNWNRQFQSPWLYRLQSSVYHNRVDHWMDDSGREDLLMGMRMDMPGWTRTSGGSLEGFSTPAKYWPLHWRFEGHTTRHFADMLMHPADAAPMYLLTWPDVQTRTAGLWAAVQHDRGPLHWHLTAREDYTRSEALSEQGIRQLRLNNPAAPSQREDFLSALSLSLGWQISNSLESGLSVSQSSRAPGTTEAWGYYLYVASDGYLYSGDPRLKPEQSTQWEWHGSWSTPHTQVEVKLYHYTMNDYIYGRVDSSEVVVPFASGWKRYTNAESATMRGAEFSLSHSLTNHWQFLAGAALQIGELTAEADPLPNLSPPNLRLTLKYQGKRSSTSLGLLAFAAQHRVSTLGAEVPTAGFMVAQLSTHWQLNSQWRMGLAVDNLLNQSFREHGDWGDALRPGRSLRLQLHYSTKQLLDD